MSVSANKKIKGVSVSMRTVTPEVGLGQFSESVYGMVTFSALSGGVGAELAGGNFWQGAIAGGILAGLNMLCIS